MKITNHKNPSTSLQIFCRFFNPKPIGYGFLFRIGKSLETFVRIFIIVAYASCINYSPPNPPPPKRNLWLGPMDLKTISYRKKPTTVTKQLTKSGKFRQNYLCDFHFCSVSACTQLHRHSYKWCGNSLFGLESNKDALLKRCWIPHCRDADRARYMVVEMFKQLMDPDCRNVGAWEWG